MAHENKQKSLSAAASIKQMQHVLNTWTGHSKRPVTKPSFGQRHDICDDIIAKQHKTEQDGDKWSEKLNQLAVYQRPSRCPSSSSSHSVLFLSVAMSTTDRQVSRLVAFFHADERPIFTGLKSASIACSQVWLGIPFGRFQSEGGFWLADATER